MRTFQSFGSNIFSLAGAPSWVSGSGATSKSNKSTASYGIHSGHSRAQHSNKFRSSEPAKKSQSTRDRREVAPYCGQTGCRAVSPFIERNQAQLGSIALSHCCAFCIALSHFAIFCLNSAFQVEQKVFRFHFFA